MKGGGQNGREKGRERHKSNTVHRTDRSVKVLIRCSLVVSRSFKKHTPRESTLGVYGPRVIVGTLVFCVWTPLPPPKGPFIKSKSTLGRVGMGGDETLTTFSVETVRVTGIHRRCRCVLWSVFRTYTREVLRLGSLYTLTDLYR